MDMDKETENKIKELQVLEHSLQSILMQKQAFQMELGETENAIEELGKTKEDVFKIVGNIMIKKSHEEILKDLKNKKDLINLRLKSIAGQEKSLADDSEKLRKDVLSKIKNN